MASRQAARRAGPKAGRRSQQSAPAAPARLAGEAARELDRLVHERVRLGLLSALAVTKSMCFSEIKRLLATSDGNLSVHARKLEKAGYIECTKSFQHRLPKTEYALTARGRRALGRYLDHMEALIRATRGE